ncbi:MAG: hypothetical protein JW821_17275 [Deltaproteobacteria bacterium]|nr:hypothetical protein [Deltaproteobacteria bacterium]
MLQMILIAALGLAAHYGTCLAQEEGKGDREAPANTMQKVVTDKASFVLYVPKGWKAKESSEGRTLQVTASDPSGRSSVFFSTGSNPQGQNATALARREAERLGRAARDLEIRSAFASRDGSSLTFDGTYSPPKQGKTDFRAWVSLRGNESTCSRIEAPTGQLATMRPVLLTVLSNIRVLKGAFTPTAGASPVRVQLLTYRLRDGSASFLIPQGWQCQDFGKGNFVAGDPAGYAFIAGNVDLLTPQMRVNQPGILVSPYLVPSQAWQFITTRYGLASNMRFERVTPCSDMARQMGQVYTAGPVTVEEFVYTFTSREGRPSRGYTWGISFGSRLNTNWSFRHITATAPAEQFSAWAGHFASMFASYKINDRWAQEYVAQGARRLREMQQQTSAMVTRNAQEIRQMMQAAYDERQRSMDYIDYQRTSYIRGQQDWISSMEGGTVYRSDTWGTKNMTTGEYWEGKPYDYVHFEGKNPKYNEQMQPVDSRALWERHIR